MAGGDDGDDTVRSFKAKDTKEDEEKSTLYLNLVKICPFSSPFIYVRLQVCNNFCILKFNIKSSSRYMKNRRKYCSRRKKEIRKRDKEIFQNKTKNQNKTKIFLGNIQKNITKIII